MAFIKLPDERPANGALTLASFEEEKRWRGKGASISGLSFPPLATQFNPSGSQASWPGLEYTRRTRLKTHLDPAIGMSKEFVEEMEGLLGESFKDWEDSMRPTVRPGIHRGKPPKEGGGHKAIQPSYVLRRAEKKDEKGEKISLSGSTRSLSGQVSKMSINETAMSKFGPVPEYLFEDREKMDSLVTWFDTYGRPTPNAINLGPRQVYTYHTKSGKRCCGEPTQVTRMHKGIVTL